MGRAQLQLLNIVRNLSVCTSQSQAYFREWSSFVGRNLRHISTDKGSDIPDGDLESKSSPPTTQNETPASQDRLEPTDASITSTGETSTPPAPRISLDLLRRRTAQRKDQELAEKYISPEFFPPMGRRSRLLDYLERQDCFKRRMVLRIPEFYVGSIMAVTLADPHATGKTSRFVGICVERKNFGLGASFKLRNVIDGQGLEILYDLYNPLIQKMEVLKLEKSVDPHLLYLRDALPEYSTIDPEMLPVPHPSGRPVPVNDNKVKMKPKPWHRRWERYELKGLDLSEVDEEKMEVAEKHFLPEYKKMDLLMMYPKYPLTEKERMRIEREWEVHENELRKKTDQGGT